MEEILASIRRIISDEEAAIGGEAEAAAPEPEPEVAEDLEAELSQDDLDALFDSPAPAAEEDPEEDDMAAAMAAEAEEEPEPEPEPEEDVLELQAEWQESDLVEPQEDDLIFAEEAEAEPEPGPALEAAVHEVLEEKVPELLKATIETTPTPDGPLPEVGPGTPLVSDDASQKVTTAFSDLTHTILSNNTRTMENVVEDLLRPMLKAWLDQNLPVMVERLVRAEIERVSRGEQHFR